MKRKIVGIFIVTLFIASFSVNAMKIDVLTPPGVDQEQTHQDGRGYFIRYNQICAQDFVPTVDLLTAVQLYIFSGDMVASGYKIKVSIRDDLNGDDLTSVTVNADSVGDYKWLSFDFPDIDVIPGEKYYIVASSDDGGSEAEENYCWFFGEDNLYSSGCLWHNRTDGIAGWQNEADEDFCFKTWHTESKYRDIDNPILDLINNLHLFNLLKQLLQSL